MKSLQPEDIVAVDESGSHQSMSPAYGRAPAGERVYDSKPKNRGKNVTMIGAITLGGMIAMTSRLGSTDGDAFLAWVREVLVPVLRIGQVVLMDNAPIHKVAGVREAIEAAGATRLLIPPYSPEFNPIEECWSKIKNLLRRAKARTLDALLSAIEDAGGAVSAQDCLGWFSHAGYLPST